MDNTPPCRDLQEVFFGSDDETSGKREREAHARNICLEHCSLRMNCLENAMVLGEEYGVWGGMGESERARFRKHLTAEGYTGGAVPEGLEFWASLNSFYLAEVNRHVRYRVPVV